MTTLRRELRQAILDSINELEKEDIIEVGFEGNIRYEAAADRLADAVLAIVNKKPAKPTDDPVWNALHGIGMTQGEIDDNKLRDEATTSFERDMKFGTLPWSSTQVWTKFEKFVIAEYSKDKLIFSKYKTWQQNEGKFHALSNRKIRENPDPFMSCWPDFLAHSAMYGQQQATQPESTVEDDGNIYV